MRVNSSANTGVQNMSIIGGMPFRLIDLWMSKVKSALQTERRLQNFYFWHRTNTLRDGLQFGSLVIQSKVGRKERAQKVSLLFCGMGQKVIFSVQRWTRVLRKIL